MSPPLTLTLFLGPFFLPFPFREGGSWSPAWAAPPGSSCSSQDRGQRQIVGGTRGCCVPAAVPQWASVSPACQEGDLTPTPVFRGGPRSQRRGRMGGYSRNSGRQREKAVGEGRPWGREGTGLGTPKTDWNTFKYRSFIWISVSMLNNSIFLRVTHVRRLVTTPGRVQSRCSPSV